MSGYLLDTHVLIWLQKEPQRIADSVLHLLGDADVSVHVSSASLWEIAIKISQKKLSIEAPGELLRLLGFRELPITSRYTNALAQLPFHHKDPFDRMLIAQAQVESLILVTSDRQMLPYDVPIITV
jgi:PIN domain nuclease of toxin-antitoxin system